MRFAMLVFPIVSLRLGECCRLRALVSAGAHMPRIDRITLTEGPFRVDAVDVQEAEMTIDVTRVPTRHRRKTKRERLSKRAFRERRMRFVEPETISVTAAAFGSSL